MRVLIVEDNDVNREVLQRMLEKQGHTVLEAVDGEAAVSAARDARPDMILMDVSLPVLDGLSATRRLRALPDTADIPIVALTAHAFVEDRDRALEAGCDAFHSKPINIRQLLSTIASLDRHGTTS